MTSLYGPGAGRLIKVEAEGLRITLPKDRESLSQVGFSIPLKVHGNFEITATFEIVEAETPKIGYGVGATMGVDDRARVGRYARPRGEQVILWDFWPVVDSVRKFEGGASPCVVTVGRMRLQRIGTILHFLWSAETSGENFDEIHTTEYGIEDTRFFTFVAESSGQPCAVDIRLVDIRIRSVSENAPIIQWSAAAVAALCVVAGGGLLGWRLVKRKGAQPRLETPETKMTNEEAAVAVSTAAVELECPNCHKRLKVLAHVVGKKVKCPGCNATFASSAV
jgi:hypothetical protein